MKMKTITGFFMIIFLFFLVACKNEKSEVLFKDDFSNEKSLTSNWEIFDAAVSEDAPSEWAISDGELFQSSNIFRTDNEFDFYEGTHVITKDGKDWKNYEFSSEFKINGDDDGVGVIFRYQDEEHYYRFITVQDDINGGPFRRLQVKDGDKYETLDETSDGYDSSKSHIIKVVVVNDKINIFYDGEKILSATDSHYDTGRVGLQCYAEQPSFDNVVVKSVE